MFSKFNMQLISNHLFYMQSQSINLKEVFKTSVLLHVLCSFDEAITGIHMEQ